MRTFAPEVRAAVRAMERFIRRASPRRTAASTFEYEEGYDSVVNDEEASALVEAAVREELGDDAFFVPPPIMGGEDFSAYLTAAAGARSSSSARARRTTIPTTIRFDWDEAAMRNGIAVLHAGSRLPEGLK